MSPVRSLPREERAAVPNLGLRRTGVMERWSQGVTEKRSGVSRLSPTLPYSTTPFLWSRSPGAIEEPGGHDIEQFEIAGDLAEDPFEIRQDGAGKLVDQEAAIRPEHRVGLAHNQVAE